MIFVRREERQSFHQLVALANWNVAVVQAFRRFAVHVEPPVALEDRLVEQRRFGAEETLHDQAVVRQCADVKYLESFAEDHTIEINRN